MAPLGEASGSSRRPWQDLGVHLGGADRMEAQAAQGELLMREEPRPGVRRQEDRHSGPLHAAPEERLRTYP
jgi:hypothetical protein